MVSVVIPLYNAEAFIRKTVESVLHQTFQDFEIIVVDDGSTDTGPDIAREMGKNDGRIRVVRIPNSGRPSVPRNVGISNSNGEFVAFLDQDDLWDSQKLALQVGLLNENPALDFVSSVAETFGNISFFSERFGIIPRKYHLRDKSYLLTSPIVCSSVVARKKVLEQFGGFDEDPRLIAVEDYDLWIRILESGEGAIVPLALVRYRFHHAGTSASREKMLVRLNYLRERKHAIVIPSKYEGDRGVLFLMARNLVHFAGMVMLRIRSSLMNMTGGSIAIVTNKGNTVFLRSH